MKSQFASNDRLSQLCVLFQNFDFWRKKKPLFQFSYVWNRKEKYLREVPSSGRPRCKRLTTPQLWCWNLTQKKDFYAARRKHCGRKQDSTKWAIILTVEIPPPLDFTDWIPNLHSRTALPKNRGSNCTFSANNSNYADWKKFKIHNVIRSWPFRSMQTKN